MRTALAAAASAVALLGTGCKDAVSDTRSTVQPVAASPQAAVAAAPLLPRPRIHERAALDDSSPPLFEAPQHAASSAAAPPAVVVSRVVAPVVLNEPPPAAPPFPLTLIGIYADEGIRRAFFLRGSEAVMVKENDVLDGQFRIESIGKTSVTVRNVSLDEVLDVGY